jgi:16S rRNA (guanine966-N2)-methyltransferase
LRIIAGQRRGKRLAGPSDRGIRPTADRIRESVFNIISDRVGGAFVLDLFAGTGAMGLEALSRGAVRACFVDCRTEAVILIGRNLSACGFTDRSRVIRSDALGALARLEPTAAHDLVFVDPPYNQGLLAPVLTGLIAAPVLSPGALIVVEHAPGEMLPDLARPWQCGDRRRYGKTLVSFVSAVI